MIAENIADTSNPSDPTYWFETIQAAPYNPPSDVSMRAVNETAVRVSWTVSIFFCFVKVIHMHACACTLLHAIIGFFGKMYYFPTASILFI